MTETDREGRTTHYEYDANRRHTAVIDPEARRTQYGYDDGRLISLADPNGNVTIWERDIQGRVTAKVFADGCRTASTYASRTSRSARAAS